MQRKLPHGLSTGDFQDPHGLHDERCGILPYLVYRRLPNGLHDERCGILPYLVYRRLPHELHGERCGILPYLVYRGLPHRLHADRDVVSYPTLCTGDSHMDFMMIEMWYLMVNLSQNSLLDPVCSTSVQNLNYHQCKEGRMNEFKDKCKDDLKDERMK